MLSLEENIFLKVWEKNKGETKHNSNTTLDLYNSLLCVSKHAVSLQTKTKKSQVTFFIL